MHRWLFGPPQPPLPQTDQALLPQPVLTALAFDHAGGPPVSSVQFVHVFPFHEPEMGGSR